MTECEDCDSTVEVVEGLCTYCRSNAALFQDYLEILWGLRQETKL